MPGQLQTCVFGFLFCFVLMPSTFLMLLSMFQIFPIISVTVENMSGASGIR